jgi:hypothetical protein
MTTNNLLRKQSLSLSLSLSLSVPLRLRSTRAFLTKTGIDSFQELEKNPKKRRGGREEVEVRGQQPVFLPPPLLPLPTQHRRSNGCEERKGGEIMALMSKKQRRAEKQELRSDCVFWRKRFYRRLLHVAKFGYILLWMIANPPASQIWRKKNCGVGKMFVK